MLETPKLRMAEDVDTEVTRLMRKVISHLKVHHNSDSFCTKTTSITGSGRRIGFETAVNAPAIQLIRTNDFIAKAKA